ncbi:MAG: DUF1553 domain-containing protein [Planctomycetes bacterium]|nr:DUF1553 domain-containing protein [Planctomycetota bacterium]
MIHLFYTRLGIGFWIVISATALRAAGVESTFEAARRIFETRCVTCHNANAHKGGLALDTAKGLAAGSVHGPIIASGDPAKSKLIEMISGDEPKMPKKGGALSAEQVESLRTWIAAGAPYPAQVALEDKYAADADWWSFKPMATPAMPTVDARDKAWVRNPIDAFVAAKLREHGLSHSAEADRRTLIRRLYFDLIGLPPEPDAVEKFIHDSDPQAYEKLVDALLASPRYGERWARHWLDVVHYGDTQGYDKDKVRPNAWPYRDYVIRSLNDDKPYGQFVKEQLAGDVLYPGDPDGIIGLGFIAAGPFDWVGQVEVGEGTMEKKQVRNIDRDDMVTTIMNTFTSLTVQCARCHNHKFDPISQEDYYSLQAVVAAVDRADRPYDLDPKVTARRRELESHRAEMVGYRDRFENEARARLKSDLDALNVRIADIEKRIAPADRPEFGYHSQIEPRQDVVKWVQIDLGRPTAIGRVQVVGAHDSYAGIGDGFGFPVRYRIEASDDATFAKGVTTLVDHGDRDVPNPGIGPQVFDGRGSTARYVRFTAMKLAERTKDYILALGEMSVYDPTGALVSEHATVTSLDSIEAPPRWRRTNLVDGYFYGMRSPELADQLAALKAQRSQMIDAALDPKVLAKIREDAPRIERIDKELAALPQSRAYVFAAATEFGASGNFRPTGGKPRVVYRLIRGSEKTPDLDMGPMKPHAVTSISKSCGLDGHFDASDDADEGDARAALAQWIVDRNNPLTWRSIVNRLWQHHFGHGIVDTPNDFGHMGALPTHPELLDWLATQFRDSGQSIKAMHRLICTSATYRQVSTDDPAKAKIDGSNQYLWRFNRLKLEAEPIWDATLAAAGELDLKMGGPGFRVFGFKDDHSPHYKYQEYDPNDPATHRRSIYRMIVRSVPDPLMATLDCADPSQIVDKRTETLTPLQALSLMNNPFMITMSEHFAKRVEAMAPDVSGRINAAYRLALGRSVTPQELSALAPLAQQYGMANVCRLILNSNEFIFVD